VEALLRMETLVRGYFDLVIGISFHAMCPQKFNKCFCASGPSLAISWLRRTRTSISLVMRAHVAAVGQIEDLHLATELKLALSYLLVLILCDLLIAWVWLHGPVRTRKMVGQTLRMVAWLRGAFEQLMARRALRYEPWSQKS